MIGYDDDSDFFYDDGSLSFTLGDHYDPDYELYIPDEHIYYLGYRLA